MINNQLPQKYAALTCDVDSLASIYKGYGCRHPNGYTSLEVRLGLETLASFLEPYDIHTTLFMVGNDFLVPKNVSYIQDIAAAGHEIANHTMTHAQGFRTLTPAEQETEISAMEVVCQQTLGQKPAGFRAPGWNMSDTALPILQRRGYLYDSSLHPTSLAPLLKFLHWVSAPQHEHGGRTTLGQWDYIFAPVRPYRATAKHLAQKGSDGLLEFPLTVIPPLRFPFWATFTLATGIQVFRQSYRWLKSLKMPLHYAIHISDFVDYTHPELQEQIPSSTNRRVPKALRTPLEEKLNFFRQVIETIAQDYTFTTIKNWAQYLENLSKIK